MFVLFLLGPYQLWTGWCALQSPSCAGGLLQLTIVMAASRGGLRVAVGRVQLDVRIRCLSGFSRDHTAGVAWAIVGTHACTRIRQRLACFGSFFLFKNKTVRVHVLKTKHARERVRVSATVSARARARARERERERERERTRNGCGGRERERERERETEKWLRAEAPNEIFASPKQRHGVR